MPIILFEAFFIDWVQEGQLMHTGVQFGLGFDRAMRKTNTNDKRWLTTVRFSCFLPISVLILQFLPWDWSICSWPAPCSTHYSSHTCTSAQAHSHFWCNTPAHSARVHRRYPGHQWQRWWCSGSRCELDLAASQRQSWKLFCTEEKPRLHLVHYEIHNEETQSYWKQYFSSQERCAYWMVLFDSVGD